MLISVQFISSPLNCELVELVLETYPEIVYNAHNLNEKINILNRF